MSEVAGRGRVTATQIATALNGVLHDCVLCTDAATGYRKYASAQEIPLHVLNAAHGVKKRGPYHLNNVLNPWAVRILGRSRAMLWKHGCVWQTV